VRRARYAADRATALDWIAGAPAALPFALVCHWLDLDAERCRLALLARAAQPRGE
jgi:hypothetical protein